MNKYFEKNLDYALKSYCARSAQTAFEVKIKEKKHMKNKKSIALAAASFCVAAAVMLGLLSGSLWKGESTGNAPEGFSITARAAELTEKKLSGVDAFLFSQSEESCPDIQIDLNDDTAGVAIEPVYLDLTGKNVKSYSFECDNGTLHYIVPDLKQKMLDGDTSITQDDYFKKGSSLKNIPYNSYSSYIDWDPLDSKGNSRYDSDFEKYLEGRGCSPAEAKEFVYPIGDKEPDKKLYRLRADFYKERYKTAEDLNKDFGGEIKVSVRYKNGKTESAVIAISYEYEYSKAENSVFGYYKLRYK